MQLASHHIHIWSTDLSITSVQEKNLLSLLSHDEKERVHRIRLSIHKQRTIAARGTLRRILALYLNVKPEEIVFGYNNHQKPYLVFPDGSDIQFNLAHSEDKAVFALSLKHAVGIDIEKIQTTFNQAIADRYFSPSEIKQLAAKDESAKTTAFYQIWSRKEAIVKAIGTGLSLPLSSFSVNIDYPEIISLENNQWTLMNLELFPNFAAAIATSQPIDNISYWRATQDTLTI